MKSDIVHLSLSPPVTLCLIKYDWVQNVQRIFRAAGVDDVDGDEPMLLQTPLYFRQISDVLQGISRK